MKRLSAGARARKIVTLDPSTAEDGEWWVDFVGPGSAVALYHGDDEMHARFVARVARKIIADEIRSAERAARELG